MYVKVHVYAGMKKESVTKTKENVYEIVTKAPAERNLANEVVREVLAREYGVSVKAIRIVNGHHNPSKLIEVIQSE
ncbi:MAG: hypothetical protein RLZZ480_666 [Candidatus Parcubacteria bacterium]|jgi:uncharacterized protein YggU (UPF0235/DUF167 family)